MNNIEKNFERGFKEKLLDKGPEISFNFFFSAHSTSKDYEGLEKAFGKSDIYIPESFLWKPETPEIYKKVSQGEMTPEAASKEFLIGPKRRRELEIIYNSKKPILLADIPFSDETELLKAIEEDRLFDEAGNYFISGELEKSIQTYRLYINSRSESNRRREEKIKENLQYQIKEFIKENPLYQKKEKLKVLVRLGAVHTNLYKELKKESKKSKQFQFSREFSQLPIVFARGEEMQRKNLLGNDELVARAMVEHFILAKLRGLTDEVKLGGICRKLASRLSLKDIEQI